MAGFPLTPRFHRKAFFLTTVLMVVALPLSNVLMSLALALYGLNFLLEGKFKQKWSLLQQHPTALLIMLLYLIHVLGLIYTDWDMNYGIKDIKTKLPLLILPLVFASNDQPFSKKQLQIIFRTFLLACIATAVVGMLIYMGIWEERPQDLRNLIKYGSHIRYSLMVMLAFYMICWDWSTFSLSKAEKAFYILAFIGLTFFLMLISVLSGFIAGVVAIVPVLWYLRNRLSSTKYRASIKAGFGIGVFSLIGFVVVFYIHLPEYGSYTVESEYSDGGEKYLENTRTDVVENGYLVYSFIAPVELEKEWNQISDYPLNGKDKKGQLIKATLLRYMSSKGLTKDSTGISLLEEDDIKAIENGVANIAYTQMSNFEGRLFEVLWEYEHFSPNPRTIQGRSVSMRLFYWDVGSSIFKDNFWIGVGTGDVKPSFAYAYESMEKAPDNQFRRRAHNQFLSIAIAFGVIGLVFFLFALLSPFVLERQHLSFLFIAFWTIMVVSFFNEDTLETHSGAIMFGFFWSLLLYNKNVSLNP